MPLPEARPELVADCDALLAARDILAGDGNLNWSEAIPLTRWDGVQVRGYPLRVTTLNLLNHGLTGMIPPELSMLTGLESLDLSHNSLRGGIPPELANLSNARTIILSVNKLTGGHPQRVWA